MRTLACMILAMSIIAAIDAAPTTGAATGTVAGTVLNSDGKAIPNQRVRFKHVLSPAPLGRTKSTLAADTTGTVTINTDKEGKFSQTLEPGEYWAESGSKSQGYAKERFTIKVGEITTIKLTLTKDEPQK